MKTFFLFSVIAMFLVKIDCFVLKPIKSTYTPSMGFFDFWKSDKVDDNKGDVSTSPSSNQQSKPIREEIATKTRFAAPFKGFTCEIPILNHRNTIIIPY
jgi:hypothetical protein